ncbi:MAG: gamma-glutamylcyclotransferase family protein [Chitinophagaceae bacterium]
MKEYLFSYGTLQKEKVQIELLGKILEGSNDTLSGYKVSAVEIKDESFLSKGEEKIQQIAIISKDKKDSINGKVFEITAEELLLTDKYEPDGYKRIKVVLKSGKAAWIYVPDKKMS